MKGFFRQQRSAWTALAFVGLVLAEAGNLIFVAEATLRANVSDILQTLIAVLAAGVFVAATLRLRREGRPAAAAWTLICVGALLLVLAQGVFWWNELTAPTTPFPTAADAVFLAAYAVLLWGLARLPRESLSRGERRSAWLDIALFSLVASVAVWELSLHDALQRISAGGDSAAYFTTFYALLNLGLLAGLYARLIVHLGRSQMFVPNLMLVGAGFFLALADLAMGRATPALPFRSGSFVDMGWMLAGAFAGFAGLLELEGADETRRTPDHVLVATWSSGLAFTGLALGAALLVWMFGSGYGHAHVLAWVTAVALALAGVRQIVAARQAARLSQRLELARTDLEDKVRLRTAELQAATDSLRESEARFRAVVENSNEGILFGDANATIHYRSPSYQRINGFADGERLGQSGFETVHPDDLPEVRRVWREVAATPGAIRGLEHRIIHKDGTARWVETSAQNLLDIPSLNAIVITSRDVTARRQAEDAAREAQARLAAAIESADLGSYEIRVSDRAVTLDARARDILGIPPEQEHRVREFWLERIHPDDRAAVEALSAQVLGREKTQAWSVYRYQHPTGGLRWLTHVSRVIPAEDGAAPSRLAGILQDITHRRGAEESLRESEERYRTLFEQAGDYILVLEIVRDGPPVIRDANAAALATHGYTREELIGQPVTTLEPDIPLEVMQARDREMRRSGTVSFEVRHQRKDGSFFDAEVRARQFVIQGKTMSISIERDISERKRAEAERAHLESELQQAQKMESVGRLAGGVAHDFNNMLGVILGHAELAISQVPADQPLHGDLAQIQQAALRSADLTRQLLAFARRQTVMPQVLDLNASISGTMKLLGRLIGEDITLAWRPGSELWQVRMDPSQLDQILANLCVNARDAIEGVGHITISTANRIVDAATCAARVGWSPGEYVCLSVADDGCGISEENLLRIFEPFFTTKSVGQGTGLGLSTVYGAVRQNNGFIDVTSQLGEGSTFWLYLPRYAGAPDHGPLAGHNEPPSVGKETVLLVEDEEAVLRLTGRILERLGYTVHTASSPTDAMRIAGELAGEVDLLLTDVIMPEMTGHALATALRAFYPQLRVLFMSGYAADVVARDGLLTENVNFIAKPFTARDLGAKVREALDQEAVKG